MTWLKKVAGAALVVSLVAGSGAAVMAATAPNANPGQAVKQAQKASPERESVRKLVEQVKAKHEQIVAEREQLQGHTATIKELMRALKADPEKNRTQLEKAKVDLRELKLLNGDRKHLNEQLEAARAEWKAAREAKDPGKALAAANRILSLMTTKLDVLKAMNTQAAQAIAHLKAAN